MKAGKFGPERRDRWLVEVAAGGRRGAQAVADLLAMTPADAATRRRWTQQAAAKGKGKTAEPTEDQVYELLYPDNPAVTADVEQLVREQSKRAVRHREAQSHDNTLKMPEAAASKGIEAQRAARARAGDPAAAATDDQLFEALFGKPRT
jgi:hypothetical protein